MDKYVWIRTQDGSPTLWNNDLGEPFRSVKGAFSESLLVFVKPALEYIKKHNLTKVTVGEFGLGIGTNWFIFSTLAQTLDIEFSYFAIEQEIEAFSLAFSKWTEEIELLQKLVKKELNLELILDADASLLPVIYPSLKDVPDDLRADVWFHDPFAFSVNAEGYSTRTLLGCSKIWNDSFLGLSYACNSNFQRELEFLNISVKSIELNAPPLKRERLEFSR